MFFEIFISLVLLVFSGYFLFSSAKLASEFKNLEKENLKLKEDLEKEISKQKELEKKYRYLQSESFWEEKIRERGYKKVGEEQYLIYPSQ